MTPGVILAACVCVCTEGRVQPLCDGPFDIQPICRPMACPPAIQPIRPAQPCGAQPVIINGRVVWIDACTGEPA